MSYISNCEQPCFRDNCIWCCGTVEFVLPHPRMKAEEGASMVRSLNGDGEINSLRHFQRPEIRLHGSPRFCAEGSVNTIPDLIDFNAKHNPTHTFALQTDILANKTYTATRITFRELQLIVRQGFGWLSSEIPDVKACPKSHDSQKPRARPVGLFLESDITLFVLVSALLSADIPVCCLHLIGTPSSKLSSGK